MFPDVSLAAGMTRGALDSRIPAVSMDIASPMFTTHLPGMGLMYYHSPSSSVSVSVFVSESA